PGQGSMECRRPGPPPGHPRHVSQLAPVSRRVDCQRRGANFDLHGEYRELRPFLEGIKRAREAAGLTLAHVSRRCGIDQPALSRLENGHNTNPTLDTLWRYAAAVGRRRVLTTEAIRDTRPAQGRAKRVRVARER